MRSDRGRRGTTPVCLSNQSLRLALDFSEVVGAGWTLMGLPKAMGWVRMGARDGTRISIDAAWLSGTPVPLLKG